MFRFVTPLLLAVCVAPAIFAQRAVALTVADPPDPGASNAEAGAEPGAVPVPVEQFLKTQDQESEDARVQRDRAALALKQLEETRAVLNAQRLQLLKSQARNLLTDVKSRYDDRHPTGTAAGFDWLPEIQSAQKAYEQAGSQLGALRTKVEQLQSAAQVDAAAQQSDEAKALANRILALLDDRDKQIDAATESIKRLYLRNHALVISGGISLGSYQAGFLYYYTLYLKNYVDRINTLRPGTAEPDTGRFKIGTGASAGSINALLSLIVGCLPANTNPETSPFYTVWQPVGIRELAQPEDVRTTGILSRRPIEQAVAKVAALLETSGTFPEHCRSIMGITATRIKPRSIEYSDEAPQEENPGGGHATIALKRQNEKFVLALDMSRDPGATFKAHRLAITSDPFVAEVYPTLGDHRGKTKTDELPVDRASVMNLIQGSAAFPVAFPPVPIPTTVWKKSGPTYELPLYTDGGFVDNTPLDLAYKIATSGRVQGEVEPPVLFLKADAMLWRPKRPDTAASQVFARPGAAPEPASATPVAVRDPTEDTQSIFGTFIPFLYELISGASDGQLTESLEKGAVKKLERRIPGRRMPVTGDFLGHFGAFLDADFRRFDFYQGMADAHDFLGERSKHGRDKHIVQTLESRIFPCFLDYRQAISRKDPVPQLPTSCQSVDANLKALLQTAAELMKTVTPDTTPEQEFDTFFGGLRRREFVYTALGDHEMMTPRVVKLRLRDTVQALARPLRQSQGDEVSKLGASLMGKTFPNEFAYRPASYCSAGFVQGLELSCSRVLLRGPFTALRLTPIFRYMNPSQVWPSFAALETRTHTMSTTVSAQTQVELAPFSELQFDLGFGWGARVRLRTYDGTFIGMVPRDWMMWRHGPEWSLSVIAYQRLYLTYSSTYYLDKCAFDNGCDRVTGEYRSYAQPLATGRFDPHLSVGWRFIF